MSNHDLKVETLNSRQNLFSVDSKVSSDRNHDSISSISDDAHIVKCVDPLARAGFKNFCNKPHKSENVTNFKTMSKQTNLLSKVVTNFHFERFNSSKFLFGDDQAPKSGLINANGKIDTSRRFIQINRRNYVYRPFSGYFQPRSAEYNKKGKEQGDHKIHNPRVLPPQIWKTKEPVKAQEVGGPFFVDEYDIDYDFDDSDEENDFDLRDDFKTKLNPEALEFVPGMVGIPEETKKETQGLLTLATDAALYAASAVGWYYTYKSVTTVSTAATAVSAVSKDVMDSIRNNLDIIGVVLWQASRVYTGKVDLDTAFMIVTGAIAGKAIYNYLGPLIMNCLTSFAPTSSSSQATFRTTQGGEITFIHGAIALIATVILGEQTEPTTLKGIMSAIKSMGSSLLTLKAVDTIVVNIIEMLPDIIRVILSEKFPTFSLYCTLSTHPELRDRLITLHMLKAKSLSELFYNSHNLSLFFNTYDYIKNAIMSENYRKAKLASMIQEDLDWLDETKDKAAQMGLLPGKRSMPYVLWLAGDSGIGKSTLAKSLADEYLRYLLNDELLDGVDTSKYVFSHNTANKYFDGYNNQPIFILNDYVQFTADEEEKWLIKFVDTIDLPLEVSSVDNVDQGIKGEVRFTSRIIIVTSNSSYLSSSPYIKELNAFNRRRDLLVKLKFKSNTGVDFENFDYSWVNMSLLDPIGYQDRVIRGIADLDELKDIMLASYLKFAERNNHLLNIPKMSERVKLIDKVLQTDAAEHEFTGLINRILLSAEAAMNFQVFGISLKYLIGCCLVGSASYVILKHFMKSVAGKFTQSLSGDVTTKHVKKNYKVLRRTMGIDVNIDDVVSAISKNILQVTTVIKHEDRLISNTMWGLALGGTIVVVPKHLLWRGDSTYKKGDILTMSWGGVDIEVLLHEDIVVEREDTDIAFINVLGQAPAYRSIEKHLAHDNAQMQDHEPAVLIAKREVSFVQTVDAFLVENVAYEDPLGKSFKPKVMWQYNVKFRTGDCGSPLLLSDVRHMRKLSGIHVAGDEYSGNSAVLTIEMLQEAQVVFKKKTTQGFLIDMEMVDVKEQEPINYLTGNLVHLGGVKPMYQHGETEIRPSPLFEVLQPHESEPAVLSPTDPRNAKKISPMLKSIAKYGTPILRFDEGQMERAFKLVELIYDPIKRHKLQTFSYNDAINATHTPSIEKLDLKTSAGYPWCTKGINKSNLIDQDSKTGVLTIKQLLNDKLNSWDNLLHRNVSPPTAIIATLKDERVSLQKIFDVKTRTFTVFPVEMTILMRRYFDDFIDKEAEHAMEMGTTIGINIYSSHWDTIYRDLKKYDFHFDGDYKQFDSTIRPEFFRYYAKLINTCYNDEFVCERQTLVSMHCFVPMVVLGDVYMKMQGNPSGGRITSSFNNFVNRMYLALAYLHLTPESWHTPAMFAKHMRKFVHGDDHLVGITSELAEYFDAKKFRDFMNMHGIDYTSSVKTAELTSFKKLEECFYLKSHFVFNPKYGKYQAGLEKSVIQEMVSWQRDSELMTTEMIINTCLRYAYFWGESYFQEIKSKLKSGMEKKRLNFGLIDFVDLDYEYHLKGQLIFDF